MNSNLFHNTLFMLSWNKIWEIILLSGLSKAGTAWLRVAVFLTHANLVRVGGWAVPSFTAPLAETKHERSVILLRLSIYTLGTPLCTCLRALNRKGYVNLMYFSSHIIRSVINSNLFHNILFKLSWNKIWEIILLSATHAILFIFNFMTSSFLYFLLTTNINLIHKYPQTFPNLTIPKPTQN